MGKPRKLSPRRAADETLHRLRTLADTDKAESCQRYFKEPVVLYGVGAKTLHSIHRDLVGRIAESWTVADAVVYCNAMIRDPHFESRALGYLVVGSFVDDSGPGLLADIKRWLERFSDNWALVDTLAPSVLAPLVARHPELIPEVESWTGSPNLWLRRGAVVAFVPLVRKQKRFLAPGYRIVTRLLDDGEDLIHKATGWMLREAGKTDAARLEKYLLRHGPRMPRTTVRYAIERFEETRRKYLLQATRPAPGKESKRR